MPFDEGPDDDDEGFRPPLPPDDRVWRHPSEMAAALIRPEPRQGPRRVWSMAMASGVLGAGALLAVLAATGNLGQRVTTRPVERVADPVAEARASDDQTVAIAERVRPAIVTVRADGAHRTSGSGILFRTDGHLMTALHIVEGASVIKVLLQDGRSLTAKLVGGDRFTDVAVLKVDGDRFATASLGTAGDLRVGQRAIAVTGPGVSVGVVSALGRRLTRKDAPDLLDMVQTDARPGVDPSGGALLDSTGAVVGLTTSAAGQEDVTFATPIDVARSVAHDLIDSGHAVYAWLGIDVVDDDHGARIGKIYEQGPAKAAGLATGDVVTAIDGVDIASMTALIVVVRTHRAGDTVTVDFLRGMAHQTATAKLMERPPGT